MSYETNPLSAKKHNRVLLCLDVAKTLIDATQNALGLSLLDIEHDSQLQRT